MTLPTVIHADPFSSYAARHSHTYRLLTKHEAKFFLCGSHNIVQCHTGLTDNLYTRYFTSSASERMRKKNFNVCGLPRTNTGRALAPFPYNQVNNNTSQAPLQLPPPLPPLSPCVLACSSRSPGLTLRSRQTQGEILTQIVLWQKRNAFNASGKGSKLLTLVSGACSMKRLGIIATPPGWDDTILQSILSPVTRTPFRPITIN